MIKIEENQKSEAQIRLEKKLERDKEKLQEQVKKDQKKIEELKRKAKSIIGEMFAEYLPDYYCAEYPAEVVRSRLLKLNSEHLEYVVDKLQENPNYNGIDNVRAYMLTCLFNAPVTCGTHYQQMANHDMFGGGWDEKEINIKCV